MSRSAALLVLVVASLAIGWAAGLLAIQRTDDNDTPAYLLAAVALAVNVSAIRLALSRQGK